MCFQQISNLQSGSLQTQANSSAEVLVHPRPDRPVRSFQFPDELQPLLAYSQVSVSPLLMSAISTPHPDCFHGRLALSHQPDTSGISVCQRSQHAHTPQHQQRCMMLLPLEAVLKFAATNLICGRLLQESALSDAQKIAVT